MTVRVDVRVRWDDSRLNAFLVGANTGIAGAYAWRIASKAKDNLVLADQIDTHRLLDSIRAEPKGGSHVNAEWTVGTDVFYAKWQEEGRGWVFPVRAKVLRFRPKHANYYVFATKARPAPGSHYLRRAVETVTSSPIHVGIAEVHRLRA